MDANNLTGAPIDNLHALLTNALPDNGEWHTLNVYVRKVNGVFQVDSLLLRSLLIPHPSSASAFSVAEPSEPFPVRVKQGDPPEWVHFAGGLVPLKRAE